MRMNESATKNPTGNSADTVAMRPILRIAAIALLVSLIFILWLNSYSDIDVRLADYFYDRRLHTFPWKESWFAKVFMHAWIKYGLIAAAIGTIVLCLIDLIHPIASINPYYRVRLRLLACSSALVPAAVSLMKSRSALHCPWDIDRYGGNMPYLRLLDAVPAHFQAGHCFPAGHATSGLWLAALAVFWLPHHPRKAALVYVLGLGVGLLLGWVQQMRGAHFLSHTLMSAWIATLVITLLTWLMLGRTKQG